MYDQYNKLDKKYEIKVLMNLLDSTIDVMIWTMPGTDESRKLMERFKGISQQLADLDLEAD